MISFYETESEARQALSDVTLIKWPQMIVTGASITREQAKEIIIRTDPFFSDVALYAGGNDQEFTIRYQQQSGVLAAVSCSDRQVQERVQEAVDSVVKPIPLDYLANDWTSSCFIYGPNGWCRPDGTIEYHDNVGKWPEAAELYDEWQAIAQAFPYLNLFASFMDAESCDTDASVVLQFVIHEGAVRVVKGEHAPVARKIRVADDVCFCSRSEHGLPWSWVAETADAIRTELQNRGLLYEEA